MSTLELSGIAHRYPGAARDTLTGVDLRVPEGEMLAVVGPSGSGKTTLLRVAAGLEPATAGTVSIDGREVGHLPPEERGLTVMFQQPHLFRHLDVLDNVAFGQRVRGRPRREAREAAARYLDLVHLGALARRRVRNLSGGQQQRVALARALATERDILLLDEPFASLDPGLRQSMHQLLDEVRAALAPTIVMVTHDLDEAGLAERVAVVGGGGVAQVGTVADLYARPRTLDVARLVGGFNELPGTAAGGRHRSAWGELRLPDGCDVAGPATLLVRREQVRLVDDPEPGPHGGALVASGQVARVSRTGIREVATVDLAPVAGGRRLRLQAELDVGETVHAGDRVRVVVESGRGLWAVASEGAVQRGQQGQPEAAAPEPATSDDPDHDTMGVER
ncbi:ABC transporter ATP-binding protein [Nocardioides sp. GCM10027113]|uniref:ABC transporter ATP-binding protein n=1 Tax=unclassified Nocardioides TaxID=2615069 RepID=UPI003622550E